MQNSEFIYYDAASLRSPAYLVDSSIPLLRLASNTIAKEHIESTLGLEK